MKESQTISATNNPPKKDAPRKEELQAIFDEIVRQAHLKDFSKAERLLDELIQKAPKAVKAIEKSVEIINKYKTVGLDPARIKPWSDFFIKLTHRETMAFYNALKKIRLRPNLPLFKQGNCDNRLYFILSGSLKLNYYDYNQKKNIVSGVLRQGDIAGVEAFFTFTNHTQNLKTAEESEILCLEKADYRKLIADFPGFEKKLRDFCEKKIAGYQAEHPGQMARRAHRRYKTSLTGFAQLIDDQDKPCKEIFEIKLVDLSASGVCFTIDNMKINDAARLHNSRIQLKASDHTRSIPDDLIRTGKVVSLKFNNVGDCSVHVQFETPIDELKFSEIAQHADLTA
ncbi:MAG: cyclic nucleotide-binding domain-containing protein [Deltaproteobacteria bacterium]|nr:cyclic nucleotide-binding domain-containing protein [Deltaproteobacteria bacterium]